MGSRSWLDWRRHWRDAFVAAHGIEPTCVACGGCWTLRHSDLHHRKYDQLGRERLDDLIPLCRACHERVPRILECTRPRRRVARAQASDVIVGRLRVMVSKKDDK
jgi:5-methylcytosine-specific restriction endonuclease McrA